MWVSASDVKQACITANTHTDDPVFPPHASPHKQAASCQGTSATGPYTATSKEGTCATTPFNPSATMHARQTYIHDSTQAAKRPTDNPNNSNERNSRETLSPKTQPWCTRRHSLSCNQPPNSTVVHDPYKYMPCSSKTLLPLLSSNRQDHTFADNQVWPCFQTVLVQLPTCLLHAASHEPWLALCAQQHNLLCVTDSTMQTALQQITAINSASLHSPWSGASSSSALQQRAQAQGQNRAQTQTRQRHGASGPQSAHAGT